MKNGKKAGIVILAVIVLLISGAAVFYQIKIKPAVNIYRAFAEAFSKDEAAESENMADHYSFQIEGMDQTLHLLTCYNPKKGMISVEEKDKGAVKLGFDEKHFWLNDPDVSEYIYSFRWNGDLYKDITEAPVTAFLGLDSKQIQELSEVILETRNRLCEKTVLEKFRNNEMLGIEGLGIDIKELYNKVTIEKKKNTGITDLTDPRYSCTCYHIAIPKEVLEKLLNSEGVSNLLRILKGVTEDLSADIYLDSDGKLVSVKADTNVTNAPVLSSIEDWKKLTSLDELLEFRIKKTETAPLSLSFIRNRKTGAASFEGKLETSQYEAFASVNGTLEESGNKWSLQITDGTITFGDDKVLIVKEKGKNMTLSCEENVDYPDPEEINELDVLSMTRLRFILEMDKWLKK